jgi:hypothetical protein
MHTKLQDWKNGWFGVELGVSNDEIDSLIALLGMLKKEPDQHFHLSSDYKGVTGVGDITVYVQAPDEPNNMVAFGKALAPGAEVPDSAPNQLPDPTSPSVTPAAGAAGAPSVAADH